MSVPGTLIAETRERFASLADASPSPRLFFAPGRANLLGAHMDYNGGVVLPVAVSKGTALAVAPRAGSRLRLRSSSFPDQAVDLDRAELQPRRPGAGWSAYLEGALWAAAEAWGELPGLDVVVCADLPMAKGLASSASIECVAVYAAARLLGVEAAPDEVVRLAHRAENEYVGVRCGILDQAAIVLAREDSVLLFDCLNLNRDHLPLDHHGAAIAVLDSGVQRELSDSAFNQRVAECTRALALLQEALPGLTCLREVRRADLETHGGRLPEVLQRRAWHVVGEAERTEAGAQALRRGDLVGFGEAIRGSHESLRDLYEVSTPELDALAAAAWEAPGCFGARLTGAGFGGCVVALVRPEAAGAFEASVLRAYRRAADKEVQVMWFSPAGGPCELPP